MKMEFTFLIHMLIAIVFTAVDDDLEEVETNRRMFQNVIDAHSTISPDLQFVAFTGGTRVSFLSYSPFPPS